MKWSPHRRRRSSWNRVIVELRSSCFSSIHSLGVTVGGEVSMTRWWVLSELQQSDLLKQRDWTRLLTKRDFFLAKITDLKHNWTGGCAALQTVCVILDTYYTSISGYLSFTPLLLPRQGTRAQNKVLLHNKNIITCLQRVFVGIKGYTCISLYSGFWQVWVFLSFNTQVVKITIE